ncbi:MAG TPA: VOC family protein [Bacteroidia bacterium]|nr:VOC family protein [Bacteroidia bacterium]
MERLIYPCLWFDNEAKQAAELYCSIFQNSKILQSTPMVTSFELSGTKFMGLNGGPNYRTNAAISYYVYCGNENEISRLYEALSRNGNVLMPLDKYDWSEKYAWIADPFGVSWQLDIGNINSSQKIVPSLLFANGKMGMIKSAILFYTGIFKNAEILLEAPYPGNANLPAGTLLFAQFKLNGYILNAMSSTVNHGFDFSPGNSFVIECDNQQAIDYYWEKLGQDGRYDRCGWLADKYGVSWQIVPSILPRLMADPDRSQRVIQAFLKMQKFDIETLENA